MNSRSIVVLPRLEKLLAQLGENLKLSRFRGELTTAQAAERAGITRTTLWQVENGAPHVSMGAYAQVLFVFGMEKDLLKLATDDELGRRLQDAQLMTGKRARKKIVHGYNGLCRLEGIGVSNTYGCIVRNTYPWPRRIHFLI